jgi:hypothetical protein
MFLSFYRQFAGGVEEHQDDPHLGVSGSDGILKIGGSGD